MRRTALYIFIFALFTITAAPLSASISANQKSPWVDEFRTADRIVKKIGFSSKNVLMGWSEPVYHIYKAGMNGENIIEAALIGGWYGIADTVGGALQLLTFPSKSDIPLPEGGTHMFRQAI